MLEWGGILKKDLVEPSDGPKVGDTYIVGMSSKSTWKRIEERNGCEEICDYTTPVKIPGTEWESEVVDTIHTNHPEFFRSLFLADTREENKRDAQVRRLQRTLKEWPICNLTGKALSIARIPHGPHTYLGFYCSDCDNKRLNLCQ